MKKVISRLIWRSQSRFIQRNNNVVARQLNCLVKQAYVFLHNETVVTASFAQRNLHVENCFCYYVITLCQFQFDTTLYDELKWIMFFMCRRKSKRNMIVVCSWFVQITWYYVRYYNVNGKYSMNLIELGLFCFFCFHTPVLLMLLLLFTYFNLVMLNPKPVLY